MARSGDLEALPEPHRTAIYPRTILVSRSLTPAEAECPGKTWAPGAGTGGQPGFHTRWRWTGQAGHRPLEVFSPGDSVLGPRRWLRVFLGLQLPHPARGGQLGPSGFNSLKSGLNYAPRERNGCDPGPPELQPPPREGIRGLLSMVSANGIHLPRTRPHGRSLGKPQEPLGPGPGISRGLFRGPGALSCPRSARPEPG